MGMIGMVHADEIVVLEHSFGNNGNGIAVSINSTGQIVTPYTFANFSTAGYKNVTFKLELSYKSTNNDSWELVSAGVDGLKALNETTSTVIYQQFTISNTGTFIVNNVGNFAVSFTDCSPGEFKLVSAKLIVNGDVDSQPVPAPAAIWLFGTGLVSLVGLKRKRLLKN